MTKTLPGSAPVVNNSQLISSSWYHDRAFIHAFTAVILHDQPSINDGRVRPDWPTRYEGSFVVGSGS